ncbi:transcriptional repressor rco-1 [Clavulina sp. PMI_390]|nr:transcriptional repressor rco-1 [Clavulina sp. PMI_390]
MPEFKKEGKGWYAIFNPRMPRVLDVDLCLTLPHEAVVCCVRFSPDGKLLATGCNRVAHIYEISTGAKKSVLAHEADSDIYVRGLAFTPDGKYLITGAEDHHVRVWNVDQGTLHSDFQGHQQEVYTLSISRNGKLVASGSGDQTVRLWEIDTACCKVLEIVEPQHIDAGVTSVAISPDSRWVAAASLDQVVRIWDIATGTLLERLRGHVDAVYSVRFNSNGRGVITGSLDSTWKYWDILPMVRAVSNANRVAGGPHGVRRLALMQGTTVSSAGLPIPSDKKDGVGELGSSCTATGAGHKDYVLSVGIPPDGEWIVSGSKDCSLQIWSLDDVEAHVMIAGHKSPVISTDFSPTGGMIASCSGDFLARVWRYSNISNYERV